MVEFVTEEMAKELCNKKKIYLSEVAEKMGVSLEYLRNVELSKEEKQQINDIIKELK